MAGRLKRKWLLSGRLQADAEAAMAHYTKGYELAKATNDLRQVSLSEIKSEHIDGAIRRELALEERARRPEWRAMPARPCSKRDVSERCCNIHI